MNSTQTDQTIILPHHVINFDEILFNRINFLSTSDWKPELGPEHQDFADYYSSNWFDNPLTLELLYFATTATRFVCDFLGGKNIFIRLGEFVSLEKFDTYIRFEIDSKNVLFRILANSQTVRQLIGDESGNVKTDYDENFICINGFHDEYCEENFSDALFKFDLPETEKVRRIQNFVQQVFLHVKTLLSRNYGVDVSNITFDDFWKKHENVLKANLKAYTERFSIYYKKFDELWGPSVL